MHANRSCRAGAIAVLAALGTAGIAVASPAHYPAPGGHLAGPALVQTLDVVLQPAGVPAWAAPPVDLPAARVAAGIGRPSAVVVPYRGGTGWCLGFAAGNTAMSGWCTPASGTRQAVEGGLVFVAPWPGSRCSPAQPARPRTWSSPWPMAAASASRSTTVSRSSLLAPSTRPATGRCGSRRSIARAPRSSAASSVGRPRAGARSRVRCRSRSL